jgi:plastocyanin
LLSLSRDLFRLQQLFSYEGVLMMIRTSLMIFALAILIACDDSPSAPSPTPSATVSIVSGASLLTTTAFSPNPLTTTVGSTIRWTNNDNLAHTSTATGGAWNSGTIQPGGQFNFTFQSAGTFAYQCTIHPGMVATVIVQ